MLRPLRQFLRLDRERRQLFLEAWRALASVRLALRFTPFKQLVETLTLHRGPVDPPALGPEALAAVQRIGWAVRAAARFTPWPSPCLVQVLAAQRMLQKRLLPGVFYIGAAPGEAAGAGSAKGQIVYVHCVAPTKVFAPHGRSNPYHLRSHGEDRKGASMRSFMPRGYLVTSLKMDATRRQVIFHQGIGEGQGRSGVRHESGLTSSIRTCIRRRRCGCGGKV